MEQVSSNTIVIRYCNKCRWMLRATWYAQELLSTFGDLPVEITLSPSDGGTFQIFADSQIIWCRKEKGGFPDVKELKQLIRDVIAPDMKLGHSERKPES